MRWRGLLVCGLHMCELEGREGMMGHPVGLATYFPLCMAVRRSG